MDMFGHDDSPEGEDDDFSPDMSMFDDEPVFSKANGLVEPREMTDCLGHESIEKKLVKGYYDGALHHGYIFSGLSGIGKATFAFRMARFILKNGIKNKEDDGGGLFGEALPEEIPDSFFLDDSDGDFRRVASGGHPDLLYIGRAFDEKKGKFKEIVDVDQIRKVAPFLQLTASQGGWRVVIVDDADKMNRNAQNALLKILEEPPSNALILLICHRMGAMVPTIRSRVQVLDFNPLDLESFTALLRRDHGGALSDAQYKTLFEITNGSVGEAQGIIEQEGLDIISQLIVLFYSWPDFQWSQIHALAEIYGGRGAEEKYKIFAMLFLWIVESILRSKATGQDLPEILKNDAVLNLIEAKNLKQWIEISGQLREHFDTFEHANLDKKQAVFGAFSFLRK